MSQPAALSASLEDYLEAIFNLAQRNQVARSKDIALALGVARPSVTGALRSLARRGLINYEPYGFVTLTPAGQRQAKRVVQKHSVLTAFFVRVLGVNPRLSQEAACRAEHALGPEVVDRLLALTQFLDATRQGDQNLVNEFRGFCRRRRHHTTIRPEQRP